MADINREVRVKYTLETASAIDSMRQMTAEQKKNNEHTEQGSKLLDRLGLSSKALSADLVSLAAGYVGLNAVLGGIKMILNEVADSQNRVIENAKRSTNELYALAQKAADQGFAPTEAGVKAMVERNAALAPGFGPGGAADYIDAASDIYGTGAAQRIGTDVPKMLAAEGLSGEQAKMFLQAANKLGVRPQDMRAFAGKFLTAVRASPEHLGMLPLLGKVAMVAKSPDEALSFAAAYAGNPKVEQAFMAGEGFGSMTSARVQATASNKGLSGLESSIASEIAGANADSFVTGAESSLLYGRGQAETASFQETTARPGQALFEQVQSIAQAKIDAATGFGGYRGIGRTAERTNAMFDVLFPNADWATRHIDANERYRGVMNPASYAPGGAFYESARTVINNNGGTVIHSEERSMPSESQPPQLPIR